MGFFIWVDLLILARSLGANDFGLVFSYFFKFLEGRFFFSCFLHRRSNKLLLSSSTGKFQKKREQRKFFSLLFERKVFENRESSKKAKIFPEDWKNILLFEQDFQILSSPTSWQNNKGF